MYGAARRSADLTRQLLTFAARQMVRPQVLDLNRTLEDTLSMLRRLIGGNIQLVWNPGGDLWRVKIDPSQVDQILVDLATNARDAIPGTGTITIQTANVVLGKDFQAVSPGFSSGEFVLIKVSDTGPGMPREVLDHLFEPFFTTKKEAPGAGLGLATLFGIVTQNHGSVRVHSEPGKGTTFLVYLPRCVEEVVEIPPALPPVAPRRGRETILLVEDEADLLVLGKTLLESLGYTVFGFLNPAAAIQKAGEYKAPIHLLLTDVVLPEMNGRELAGRLVAIRPDLKCLFMSGYSDELIAQRGLLPDGALFIQKPFTVRELGAKIRATLDHPKTVDGTPQSGT
jgi:CheY-like chemotaxis protein